jgi:hypothetical protein
MIAIYRTLLFVSGLLFIASLILPRSHGFPINKRLSVQTNDWAFTFATTNHQLFGATEEQSKAMLLRYFREHEADGESPLGWLTLGAGVAVVFSFVGWRREVYWQKQGQKQ